jgi:cytochrome c oxidase cbb3-type subunit I
MTSAQPHPQASLLDDTAVEAAGRGPLLLLLGFSLVWLLVSGVLGLIAAIQIHTPAFLADCCVLTYGRTRALQETAFVYGWIANGGLALTLWILGRLGGEPLRAVNWVSAGAVFWNLGVAVGLVGIATGDATSLPYLEMPGYVQPLLLAAYGAMGVAGVLAWSGRRRPTLFASQWYAVALLFLFPWIFSAGQVMLIWAPVHGVLQAIVQGWFAQSLWTLWMAPLGLAGAYYVLPKVTGRVLPAYDLASLGFWCLLFIGGWTGGRHLIGGPVPAWISTVAIVTSAILLSHYIIVLLNLRGAFGGGGTALRFIAFGVAAYVLGGFLDAATAMRVIAVRTQFTWFDDAQQQLAVYGGVSMMLFGTLYYALPRLTGRPWASAGLLRGHLVLSFVGLALLIVSLAFAGLIQGGELNYPMVSFTRIAQDTRPWLRSASVAQAILLFGNLLLAVNFARTVGCGKVRAVAEALSS